MGWVLSEIEGLARAHLGDAGGQVGAREEGGFRNAPRRHQQVHTPAFINQQA